MRAIKVEYLFVVINPDGSALKLNIAQTVQLACFIGARLTAAFSDSSTWRFLGNCMEYKSAFDVESGYQGTFHNYTLDWFVGKGKGVSGYLRYGNKVRSVTKSEVLDIYRDIIKEIAVFIPGLKFPSVKTLTDWERVKETYTGFGFIGHRSELGILREIIEGKPTRNVAVNQCAFIGNQSIPRPTSVEQLCFGTDHKPYQGEVYRTVFSDNRKGDA